MIHLQIVDCSNCNNCSLHHTNTTPPGGRRSSASTGSRRSSSEVMKRMLYGSATKEDLKNRTSVSESDSDLTSDEAESSSGGRSSSDSSQHYFLKKSSSTARINLKLRRNSVEDSSERDASPSPPLDTRSKMNLKHSRTLPRRTKSSSNTNIASQNNRKTSYAFGSSTERFCNKQENDTRSSQDNLLGSEDTFLDINYQQSGFKLIFF